VAKTTDNTVKFLLAARRSISIGITNAAGAVASEMKRGMTRGTRFKGSTPGTPPNRQRSNLVNSIGSTPAKNKGRTYTASAGSASPYGGIHERGGTIRPRPGNRYLVIPVNIAAKRAMERTSGGVRSLKTRVFRSKKGNLIMIGDRKVRYTNKQANIKINDQPVFVLKESVTMPKRPWAAPGLQTAIKNGRVDSAIKQAVKRGMVNFAAGVAK
jgi:phage gpG-like protein